MARRNGAALAERADAIAAQANEQVNSAITELGPNELYAPEDTDAPSDGSGTSPPGP